MSDVNSPRTRRRYGRLPVLGYPTQEVAEFSMAVLTAKAEDSRKRADELAQGIEALLGRWASLVAVPLDVLDRVERAIVKAHVDNMLRLNGKQPPVEKAVPAGASASLHDLTCMGPASEYGCTCRPVYVA